MTFDIPSCGVILFKTVTLTENYSILLRLAECFIFQLTKKKPARRPVIQPIFRKKDGRGENKGSSVCRTLLRDCWLLTTPSKSGNSLALSVARLMLFSPRTLHHVSLFTDPLFSLQSLSSVGDILSRAPRSPMFSKKTKRKIKQRLCTG